MDIHDKNLFTDLSEFFIGFFGIIVLVSFLNYHKVKHSLVDKTILNWF
jgi:hypothetical protein